ncbi:endonuclease domain-containing protein [Microbacterium sp. RD1]|uniref:endonuclease domain-containing protein n=1 Tax=Microbacterium sp. RD1 TaxID=3457313 RepID=UPI003FA61236
MDRDDLSAAFTVSEGRAAGLSPGRMRSRAFDAPFWGTRSARDLEDDERLRLLLSALPSHTFACGATAGVVLGLPLPLALEKRAYTEPLVGVPLEHNRIRRPGVRGRALAIGEDDVVTVGGIRCTSPARTWCELAGVLGLGQLVAVTDRILSRLDPLATREQLEEVHRRVGRSRGAAQRPLALEWSSSRSESPRESELRVLLLQAGLPMPECNVEVFHGRRFVARVDMMYAHARLIIEYDGDYHRDRDQWSRDASRRAELESLGYRVTVVTARDFDDPRALVARIRRLLAGA